MCYNQTEREKTKLERKNVWGRVLGILMDNPNRVFRADEIAEKLHVETRTATSGLKTCSQKFPNKLERLDRYSWRWNDNNKKESTSTAITVKPAITTPATTVYPIQPDKEKLTAAVTAFKAASSDNQPGDLLIYEIIRVSSQGAIVAEGEDGELYLIRKLFPNKQTERTSNAR